MYSASKWVNVFYFLSVLFFVLFVCSIITIFGDYTVGNSIFLILSTLFLIIGLSFRNFIKDIQEETSYLVNRIRELDKEVEKLKKVIIV
jgi:hypothetical protein